MLAPPELRLRDVQASLHRSISRHDHEWFPCGTCSLSLA